MSKIMNYYSNKIVITQCKTFYFFQCGCLIKIALQLFKGIIYIFGYANLLTTKKFFASWNYYKIPFILSMFFLLLKQRKKLYYKP